MKSAAKKTIIAIETSCDETAAAVLAVAGDKSWPRTETLSSIVRSQIRLHSKFGGVVPEVAARAHVRYIRPVVEQALSASRFRLSDIDYIAVTSGPGLVPSLIVGVEFAKTLAFAQNKPLIPVNHMLGHLYSPLGKFQDAKSAGRQLFPMVSLIVSGGHTMIVLLENEKKYRVLGETVDDAAGEAFDKVAKLLGLPYPGGPEVSRLAAHAKQPVIFPRPMIHSKDYNFSFAGLKTSVLYYYQANLRSKTPALRSNICAGFEMAAVDVLVTKAIRAAKEFGARSVSLSGGVSANRALREELGQRSKVLNLKFFVPPFDLCTDNAEMIGLAAAFMLHNGFKPKKYSSAKADPNLSL